MANWIVAFSVLILFACNGDLTISSRSTPTEGDREDANAAVEMPDPDIDGEGADVEMPDSGEEDEGEGDNPSDREEDHDEANKPIEDEGGNENEPPVMQPEKDALGFKKISVPDNNKLSSEKRKFIWPVDGWITSTYYRSDRVKKHGGSADITIPFGTPIVAIRDGEVTSASRSLTSLGGYLVKINHGHGYHSLYSHLIQPSHLKVGDKVKTGDLIGRVGRTGNANMTHLHFALYKNGAVVNIAGLDFGDWVQQGNFLGGSYPELTPISSVRGSFMVKAPYGAEGQNSPSFSGKIVKKFAKGSVLRVTATRQGFFQVEGGQWIQMGALNAADFTLYHLKVKTATKAYESASTSGKVYSDLKADTLLTAFSSNKDFERILYRRGYDPYLTCKFLYVPKAMTTRTGTFTVLSPGKSIKLFEAPSFASKVVLDRGYVWGKTSSGYRVYENRAGWFKVRYKSRDAWLPSAVTSGSR